MTEDEERWEIKKGHYPIHWVCHNKDERSESDEDGVRRCLQPNAKQRDTCLACGDKPKVKHFEKRKYHIKSEDGKR